MREAVVGLAVKLGKMLFVVGLDVAAGAVAAASRGAVVARLVADILARLLHGALDSEALHIGVGRDLGLDVMPLDEERERQCKGEERHGANRYENYKEGVRHILFLLANAKFGVIF